MNPAKLTMTAGLPTDPFSDFRNFLHYLCIEVRGWEYVGKLQYDIADFIQNLPVGKDGIARGQVQSLRGAGKTEVAVAYCLWRLYLKPTIKILAISSVLSKSQEFVGLALQIIKVTPLLYHLKPQRSRDGVVEKDQKDNEHGFVVGCIATEVGGAASVSKELSLASFPIFGTFTGSHPDVIVSDDVETPENALTAGKRQRLLNKIYEFMDLINPGGTILIQGTPQTEDSVYLHIEKKGFALRRWPAWAPALTDQMACINVSPWILGEVKAGRLRPGEPTYPERFNADALAERLAFYGPSRFALQMLLDTKLADADRYPLKLRNLIVMDMHHDMAPEAVLGKGAKLDIDHPGLGTDCFHGPSYRAEKYTPYSISLMWIDPKGRGGDTVGYAVIKVCNGVIYTHEVGGVAKGKGVEGFAEPVLEKLARIALKHTVKVACVEDNFGDGMYARLLMPIMARINGATEIRDRKSKGQKELRIINILEPLVEAGKLAITPQVAQQEILMNQYTRITKDAGSLQHEDELEAWACACGEVAEMVAVDPVKAEAQASQRERKAMARDFQQNAWGFLSGAKPAQKIAGRWTSRAGRRWK